MKIGQKYGWDSIDPGHGQGYDELYFDTRTEYTSATQRQLAVNIVKTVDEINKFFTGMNSSLQATGLPGYKVSVWQGMGENGNINQYEDLSHITNIAKGQTAKPDAGPAIGKMILKHLPSYEAENDELGYDPQDFQAARNIANIYITKGERAGLQAQGDSEVSEMIDELLSDAGASGLRTIWELDEQGMAEGAGPATHRIGLTVTDPNHPMVSKRGETYHKTVRVTGDDREKAINQAIAHYRRKGYKVHDHHYIGTVDNEPVAEGMAGKVVFRGTGADGGTYEIIQSSPTDFMIHANGKHIDTYGSLQRAMSVLKNEVPGLQQGMAEENKGLYYNVNKRKKAGTSRDANHPKAPTAQAWKDAAKTAKNEAVNFDRSKNPNYPNDAATQKHRLDTAKRLLSDPKTDDASRKEAAAIIARMEPKGKK
jgi:hypothetical protein